MKHTEDDTCEIAYIEVWNFDKVIGKGVFVTDYDILILKGIEIVVRVSHDD